MSIGMIRVVLTAIFLSVSAAAWAQLASWEKEGRQALESRNYPLALQIYQRAAEQGEVKSSYHIGVVYAYQQDWKQKMFWWLKGAEEGDSTAQFEVAQIFLGPVTSGMDFVPQDYVQAYKWYELAAKDPSGRFAKDGIEGRDMAAGHMTPAQIKQAQALVRKWKPKAVTTSSTDSSTTGKQFAFIGSFSCDSNPSCNYSVELWRDPVAGIVGHVDYPVMEADTPTGLIEHVKHNPSNGTLNFQAVLPSGWDVDGVHQHHHILKFVGKLTADTLNGTFTSRPDEKGARSVSGVHVVLKKKDNLNIAEYKDIAEWQERFSKPILKFRGPK